MYKKNRPCQKYEESLQKNGIFTRILRDKTIIDDDKQNYHFCIINLLFLKFETNQSNFVKNTKSI